MTNNRQIIVGEALADKMIAAGIGADRLSVLTGIPAGRIEDIRQGRTIMDVDELYRICGIFRCAFEEFFVGIYDFSAYRDTMPINATQEYRETVLLHYFRQIQQPSVKDYLCGMIKSIVTTWNH